MNLLQNFLALFKSTPTAGGSQNWSAWFDRISTGWSMPAPHDTSPAPSPIASTPAEKTPAPATATQTEGGQVLAAVLDLLSSKPSA